MIAVGHKDQEWADQIIRVCTEYGNGLRAVQSKVYMLNESHPIGGGSSHITLQPLYRVYGYLKLAEDFVIERKMAILNEYFAGTTEENLQAYAYDKMYELIGEGISVPAAARIVAAETQSEEATLRRYVYQNRKPWLVRRREKLDAAQTSLGSM